MKQNLQMFRFEMHKDVEKSNKRSKKSLKSLNNGVNILNSISLN
jgi:hypothetical protein